METLIRKFAALPMWEWRVVCTVMAQYHRWHTRQPLLHEIFGSDIPCRDEWAEARVRVNAARKALRDPDRPIRRRNYKRMSDAALIEKYDRALEQHMRMRHGEET